MIKNKEFRLYLQLFADGGAAGGDGGAPAGDAGTAAGGEAAENDVKILEDGTRVDARFAALQEKQAERIRRRGGRPAQSAAQATQPQTEDGQQQAAAPQQEAPAEKTAEEEWAELKKSEKYSKLYGADVQAAIQDRFKNQADANAKLQGMQPMLNALMKKAGVQTVEELQNIILDDDSLYEEDAEKMGMPVEAYKQFKQLQDEHDAAVKAQEQNAQDQMFRRHLAGLFQQGEALKQKFPDFDLRRELQNPAFMRMTSPEGGLDVESAYFAVHHNELMPQAMAYGIQKAQDQISKSLATNARRPMEGAAGARGQAVEPTIDPRKMTRAEREEIKRRVRVNHERIVF